MATGCEGMPPSSIGVRNDPPIARSRETRDPLPHPASRERESMSLRSLGKRGLREKVPLFPAPPKALSRSPLWPRAGSVGWRPTAPDAAHPSKNARFARNPGPPRKTLRSDRKLETPCASTLRGTPLSPSASRSGALARKRSRPVGKPSLSSPSGQACSDVRAARRRILS